MIAQAGYEHLAAQEAEVVPVEQGRGWLRIEGGLSAAGAGSSAGADRNDRTQQLAFPHLILREPTEIRGESVNAFAGAIADWFLASLRGEQVTEPWPAWWDGPAELVGLGRRITSVEAALGEVLRKRMSRVARLAAPSAGAVVGPVRGLFVWFADFQRAFVSRSAIRGGQRRMADDPAAPSRSYLKVEEAYRLLGKEPARGESVIDLGAAPGGWSYSAARRGARVLAVDNGPLKAGAAAHPAISHLRADAFRFEPEKMADWLFADLVEEPHHVVANLLRPWLERRWCRRFIFNLKFGRVDPVALLRGMRAQPLPHCEAPWPLIRHLYHDREEFTLVGEVSLS